MKRPISWVKPDKNQPRTHFRQDTLRGMAESIKAIGIINPIEVDPTGMIITGERRYRAMKLAGFKELEEGKEFVINRRPLTPYERKERQVIENIQQASIEGEGENMNPIDVAESYRDMLKEIGKMAADGQVDKQGKDRGITYLAGRLGVDRKMISRSLKLLEESAPIKKALRRRLVSKSEVEEISVIKDPETKEVLKKRLLKGELSGSKNIRAIAKAIRENPEKKEIYVQRTFTEKTAKGNEVINFASRMSSILRKNNLKDIQDTFIHAMAKESVEVLRKNCVAWLGTGEIIDIKPKESSASESACTERR